LLIEPIRIPAERQQDIVARGGEQPGRVAADPADADNADLFFHKISSA